MAGLGRHFETNSADANHQVAKMLYRIATEIKCLPMLWHYSFFKARMRARAWLDSGGQSFMRGIRSAHTG